MPHSVFSVVHNIVMCGPTLSDVCVADRENGRIQIFDKEGNFLRIFEDKKKIGQRLFAIAYSPSEGESYSLFFRSFPLLNPSQISLFSVFD